MHIFSYAFCSGSSCSLLESTYRFSLAPAQGSYALETLIPRKNNALSFWVSHIFIFPSSSNTWVAPPSSFSASVPAPRAHHPWTHYRVRHPMGSIPSLGTAPTSQGGPCFFAMSPVTSTRPLFSAGGRLGLTAARARYFLCMRWVG